MTLLLILLLIVILIPVLSVPFCPFRCSLLGERTKCVFEIRSHFADIEFVQTISLAEAQKHLAELVRDLPHEGEWVITDGETPVARLTPASGQTSLRNLAPTSVGAVLRPFPSPDDDLLGEMLDAA